jgi:succinyl-CoA synthetase beta subunit
MARLHEYQGKTLLSAGGISIPRGQAVSTPGEAAAAAKSLGAGPCVVKIQAWTTGRAAMGGIAFANTPEEAAQHAERMLGMTVGQFPITHVLVEEKLAIASEIFVSVSVDDRARAPVILVAFGGGSGIEGRAASVSRIPCDVHTGPERDTLERAIDSMPLAGDIKPRVISVIVHAFAVAKSTEARSLEINPLVVTADGRVVAADCRITIDDYAVFRHPELGIEIARELDHPPTPLEKIAYRIEQQDHRGTFFFAQMNTHAPADSKGLIGFHGAGGGGSMMSMDAITNEGFTIANFCDTSGNPSPAKVYCAARIILSQPGLIGYFGSGSGVANQEQFWSAYGLAKAFWEMELNIPAVIRLGGNTEDRAVDILRSACKDLPACIEGYRKSDTPAQIAHRFAALVSQSRGQAVGLSGWQPRPPRKPGFVGSSSATSFPLKHGRLWLDPAIWSSHAPAIIARCGGLLRDDRGQPALAVTPEALLTKDSDLIAAEVECRRENVPGLFVELDIPGLDTAGRG